MKGSAKVIKVLGDVLSAELTAINQYIVHAEMCENWGYGKLAGHIKKEAIDEMKHAEKLIERIIYFDAAPDVSKYFKINIGKKVDEQIKNDLKLEKEAVSRLNKGIAVSVAEADNGSRELLEGILTDEEEHVDLLEGQLDQIKQMGIQNFLAMQVIEEG